MSFQELVGTMVDADVQRHETRLRHAGEARVPTTT
jgi:hypothetical protein